MKAARRIQRKLRALQRELANLDGRYVSTISAVRDLSGLGLIAVSRLASTRRLAADIATLADLSAALRAWLELPANLRADALSELEHDDTSDDPLALAEDHGWAIRRLAARLGYPPPSLGDLDAVASLAAAVEGRASSDTTRDAPQGSLQPGRGAGDG